MANQAIFITREDPLSNLPAELRVEIFGLVTYHGEGDGVICPKSDIPGAINYVYMDGGRWRVMNDDLFTGIPVGPTDQQQEWHDTQTELYPVAKAKHGEHLCTLDCLKQPAITRVSSLYRKESLPLFYQRNTFHFEFGQFETMQWTCDLHRRWVELVHGSPPVMDMRPRYYPSYGWDIPFRQYGERFRGFEKTAGRSPVDWWRAVGDKNLSMIRTMTMILPDISPLKRCIEHCWEVKFDFPKGNMTIDSEVFDMTGVMLHGNDCNLTGRLFDKQADRDHYFVSKRMRRVEEHNELTSDVLDSVVDQIRDKRLHAAGLERILAFFEPALAYWLRDDELLIGDSWNVFVLKRVLALV